MDIPRQKEATIKLTQKTTARFDYVQYDDMAKEVQEHLKLICTSLEMVIDRQIQCPRSKQLALTKLEEVYMWIGKGVRNDQIVRHGEAPHTPERSAS